MDARRLDALLAEHLFGYQPVLAEVVREAGGVYVKATEDYRRWGFPVREMWVIDETDTTPVDHYSTTWAGVGAVIEAMREKGWAITVLTEMAGYSVTFSHIEVRRMLWTYMSLTPGHEWDLPLAASVAALRALGVEVPDA